MKRGKPSPLIGQMTLFLLLFLIASVLVLMILGKAVEINIKDFWGNTVNFPIETIALGCVSIVLFSHFGANVLARPILTLNGWAEDDTSPFPEEITSRKDEFGQLARTLVRMRMRLEREREIIASDRDLYKALNEMSNATMRPNLGVEAISNHLSIAVRFANAEAAYLVRRDPDGGGFSILAAQTSKANASTIRSGGFLLDALIPDALLVRFLDKFEIPFSSLEDDVKSWADSEFGHDGSGERSLINLPVARDGRYIGSLVLIGSKARREMDRLGLLADSIADSARYVEASIARDDNWSSIMTSLSNAVDAKSEWTKGHSERVSALANAVGKGLLMDEKELSELNTAALLHDVGKIAISDAIIDKPARLTETELSIMRQHPDRGAKIVEMTPGYRAIRSAILHHHERWDGKGYPEGLAGDEIPLHSRIIAIADVYDAISSDRPYRIGMPRDEALQLIESQAGSAFDPRLTRLFCEMIRADDRDGVRA